MNFDNKELRDKLYNLLSEGYKLEITVKSGSLGCCDVQDACNREGSVILFQKGDNYMINTISDDDNILCVDDFEYIVSLIDTFKEL